MIQMCFFSPRGSRPSSAPRSTARSTELRNLTSSGNGDSENELNKINKLFFTHLLTYRHPRSLVSVLMESRSVIDLKLLHWPLIYSVGVTYKIVTFKCMKRCIVQCPLPGWTNVNISDQAEEGSQEGWWLLRARRTQARLCDENPWYQPGCP